MTTYDSNLERYIHGLMPKLQRLPQKASPSIFQVTLVQNYNPDFKLVGLHRTIYVEAKGRLDYEMQRKLAHLKPHERACLKLVVTKVSQRYNKLVRQSIWDWANKLGIECVTPECAADEFERWQREADMPEDEWVEYKGLTKVDTTPVKHKRRTRQGVGCMMEV